MGLRKIQISVKFTGGEQYDLKGINTPIVLHEIEEINDSKFIYDSCVLRILAGMIHKDDVALYKRFAEIHPKEFWLNKLITFNLLSIGDEEVIKQVKNPKDEKEWVEKGNSHYYLKNFSKAIEYYQKAVEIKEDYQEAWYNMGTAFDDNIEYENAIVCYQKAVEIQPSFHEAWNNMGIAYGNLEKFDKAIECYQKAVEIKNDKPEAWNNMGIAYVNLKSYEKAIECYQRAVEIKPDLLTAYPNLIEVLIIERRLDESIAYLTTAKKYEEKRDFDLSLFENIISIIKNNFKISIDDAITELKSVVENDPNKVNWSFKDTKYWLSSPKSSHLTDTQRSQITELIQNLESWIQSAKKDETNPPTN